MTLKNKMKEVERALGRYAMFSSRWIISRMPYPVFRAFRRVFIAIGRPLLIKKRQLAMQNLRIAFGKEKSDEEIEEIATRCFNNFGRGMVDLLYFIDRPEEIMKKADIVGKEHLDKAFAEGKGAIVVSAHFGNFILMYLRMLYEGYPTNVIMRRVRDEAFEKYISDFRDERGLKTIYDLPPRKCVQQCIKALRNNELLFILLDQNYGSDGRVFVDFFGQKAATATGPVIFANRTKSPIFPIFIMRDTDNQHKVVIEPEIKLEEYEDPEENLVKNVSKITKIIETHIRQYPHEWGGWMHNRWKSRTIEEQMAIDRMSEKREREGKNQGKVITEY